MFEYKRPMLVVIWIVLLSVCGYLTKEKDRTDLFVTSMVYFNFPLSLTIVIAAWGCSVYLFDKHLVPYEHTDILDLEPPRTPGPVIMMSGLYMSLAVGSALTLYWVFFALGLPTLAPVVPLILYLGSLLYCIYHFWQSRLFLWTRVKRAIRRPEDVDLFFADILTSFSKDLADLSTAICSMLVAWRLCSTDLNSNNSLCGRHSWVAAAISASPSLLRLLQCIWLHFFVSVKDMKDRTSEVVPRTWLNVARQVGQLSLIFLARMYYTRSPEVWSSYYRPAWVGIMIVLTGFSIYSDLFIDWNLGISDWLFRAPTVTSQIFTGARRWLYYVFIVLDILFRVSWAWRLSDFGSNWLPFVLSIVEIARRAMWFPLRIEGWQVSLGIGPRGTAQGEIGLPAGGAAVGEVELPLPGGAAVGEVELSPVS